MDCTVSGPAFKGPAHIGRPLKIEDTNFFFFLGSLWKVGALPVEDRRGAVPGRASTTGLRALRLQHNSPLSSLPGSWSCAQSTLLARLSLASRSGRSFSRATRRRASRRRLLMSRRPFAVKFKTRQGAALSLYMLPLSLCCR